jgi:hypothetical protein
MLRRSISANSVNERNRQRNTELARSVYDRDEEKQVTAWLGLRTDAAHGQYACGRFARSGSIGGDDFVDLGVARSAAATLSPSVWGNLAFDRFASARGTFSSGILLLGRPEGRRRTSNAPKANPGGVTGSSEAGSTVAEPTAGRTQRLGAAIP